MTRSWLCAGAAIVAAPALFACSGAHAEGACADLLQAKLPHAQVTSAKVETLKSGQACRVAVTSKPTSDSDIRIEVMIPLGSAWNGKYVQVGNGGLAGAIPTAPIKARAEAGYASAGTDDGHQANNRSAAWALGHPEKIVDFATRSLKETTDIAKLLIADLKGAPAKRSYFVGCSAGGREALMEAQRFPNDFDGIVSGAPANYNTLSTGGRAYMQQALTRPGGYLGMPQLQLLQTAALKQCADGGPFIRDQMACHFDPASLQCKPGKTEGCLTSPQVASAKALYGGRVVAGRSMFPGYTPGAEAADRNGYQAWNTGPSLDQIYEAQGHATSSQFMKYFIYSDPSFDFLKADLGAKYDRDRQKVALVLDAVNPDLRPFMSHGGKLIQYHGWNDPAIPPLGSVRYHDELAAKMGDTSGFYRLYMVPGMLHCAGGAGPGGVDWLALLERWVEDKAEPGEVTAEAQGGETQLICPYPGVARKKGASYACSTGKPKA